MANPMDKLLNAGKHSINQALEETYLFFLQKLLRMMYVNENGCWIFTGYIDPETGYGQLNLFYNKKVKPHRFMAYCFLGLDLFNLKIQACHSCDVRECINPMHLWLGTKSENFKDSAQKGRWHSDGHYGKHINHLKEKDWGKYKNRTNS